MAAFKERHSLDDRPSRGLSHQHIKGKVAVGPILNAGKLRALLLADGNSARSCKTLDFSHSNIRKIELSLGEVSALDFEFLTDLDLHGNLLVTLDGHSLPFPHLQILRASNCRIRNILNFGAHFRLRELDLSGNQLTDIMGLANTPLRFTLQALLIGGNDIKDFKGLATLSTLESLEVLDLRGNPILDFGLVAEGYALLCCHTLRQLNGHTVSTGVRDAVDAWALDDTCGRATAATVEAFRDALLHSDGRSLFPAAGLPRKLGRVSNPMRNKASAGSSADIIVTTDLRHAAEDGESVSTERPVLWNDGYQQDSGHSRLSSASSQGRRASAGRVGSSGAHVTLEKHVQVPEMDACSSARRTQSSSASGVDVRQEVPEGAKEKQRFSECDAQSRGKEATGFCGNEFAEFPDGLADLALEAADALQERKARQGGSGGFYERGPCVACELCLCPPLPHGRYYHTANQTGCKANDVAWKTSAPCRRGFEVRELPRCCAGTQTPAGWARPLQLSDSNMVLAVSEEDDNLEKESEANCAFSPPHVVDGLPSTSDPGKKNNTEVAPGVQDTVVEAGDFRFMAGEAAEKVDTAEQAQRAETYNDESCRRSSEPDVVDGTSG